MRGPEGHAFGDMGDHLTVIRVAFLERQFQTDFIVHPAALPERQPYPSLYLALSALLDAVCHAPSARGWLPGLVAYEGLLLRELGYGGAPPDPAAGPGDKDAITAD